MIDALPASIRVGPYDFAIKKMEQLECENRRAYGVCEPQLLMISIQRLMPSPQRAVDVFLHEVLHAAYWVAGIDDADKEERIITHFSTHLTMVFRNNPWLTGWIKKGVA